MTVRIEPGFTITLPKEAVEDLSLVCGGTLDVCAEDGCIIMRVPGAWPPAYKKKLQKAVDDVSETLLLD